MKIKKKAFTLIEIIVAITITSMVLISIVQIFIFSWMFAKKIDSSRMMQENIKNFTEIIAEDVRNNWIDLTNTGSKETLKTWTWTNKTEYYLSNNSWSLIKVSDYSYCKDIKKESCFLVRKKGSEVEPLINSHIAFENLNFDISWNGKDIPKVTMNFTIRPAIKKWLSSKKVKKAKIIMQTTFSERLYRYKKK